MDAKSQQTAKSKRQRANGKEQTAKSKKSASSI